MTNPRRSFHNLNAITDLQTRLVLQSIVDRLQGLEGREGETPIWEADIDANGQRLTNLAHPSGFRDAVTVDWATKSLPKVLRDLMSARGTFPLDVTGLRGKLADAQFMSVEIIPDEETLPTSVGEYPNFVIITWRGALYYLDSTVVPPQWRLVTTVGTIFYGTHDERLVVTPPNDYSLGVLWWETDRLSLYFVIADPLDDTQHAWRLILSRPLSGDLADIPIDLDALDDGFTYHAQDFDRVYRWTGTVWEDAPGQPPREMVAFFVTAPGAGWALCDGATVDISTADAGIDTYVTPDLITANLFVRAAGTSGGTGGAETHLHSIDPPNTTSTGPSSTFTAASGVAGDVGDLTHTHDVNIAPFDSAEGDNLPPYMDLLPYVRL